MRAAPPLKGPHSVAVKRRSHVGSAKRTTTEWLRTALPCPEIAPPGPTGACRPQHHRPSRRLGAVAETVTWPVHFATPYINTLRCGAASGPDWLHGPRGNALSQPEPEAANRMNDEVGRATATATRPAPRIKRPPGTTPCPSVACARSTKSAESTIKAPTFERARTVCPEIKSKWRGQLALHAPENNFAPLKRLFYGTRLCAGSGTGLIRELSYGQ